MSIKDYEELLRLRKGRICCNCKFYDGCCCMYDCALKAILHEDVTAKHCEYFELGEYSEEELEKNNYK